MFLFLPGTEKKEPLLAEKEGWALLRGVPGLSGRALTLTREQLWQGEMMLASPAHPLPRGYVPPDTRSVRAMVGSYLPAEDTVCLYPEAIYALCVMQFDHSLHDQIAITQGILSGAQQNALRLDALARCAMVYPLEEALSQAIRAVPAAGESEHQTGYALDLVLLGPLALGQENPLRRTETGQWLYENLWRYGFIQRFAPHSADEGACENIHLRYVGKAHAAAMRVLGLDLEPYLDFLHREPSLTLLKDGQPYAYISCVPEGPSFTLTLPENAAFQASADNQGFVVSVVAAQGNF